MYFEMTDRESGLGRDMWAVILGRAISGIGGAGISGMAAVIITGMRANVYSFD
jgi:hypothetical protein